MVEAAIAVVLRNTNLQKHFAGHCLHAQKMCPVIESSHLVLMRMLIFYLSFIQFNRIYMVLHNY